MLKWLDAMFEDSGLEEVEVIVGENEAGEDGGVDVDVDVVG